MTLFGARLGELAQPLFPPRQFFRDRKTIGNIGLIGRFGLPHQIGHFGLQLRFDLAGVFVGQRAVPAAIGVDFGSIKPNRAQLQNPISRARTSTCTNRPSICLRNRRRNVAMVS
jgi:hypothetical protein